MCVRYLKYDSFLSLKSFLLFFLSDSVSIPVGHRGACST